MVMLPKVFLEWNFYPRRRLISETLNGRLEGSPKFFLEFTRHNPVLCTAAIGEEGNIEVNSKVVGIGYVVKKEHLNEKVRIFQEHIAITDEEYAAAKNDKNMLRRIYREHAKRGLKLLLNHLYSEPEVAERTIDFEKLATIELAARLPHSSKHTWRIVQRNRTASILFFQPPRISFELKGRLTIHIDDDYSKFVTSVHDTYHYTPPEKRGFRPVYIFHVEEVYDNSPTPKGYGRKIA